MKTKIDYFQLRTQSQPAYTFEMFRRCLKNPDFWAFMPPEQGVDGWEYRRAIYLMEQQPLAWIDYGGESQRGWVRLTMAGTGCGYVEDWERMQELGVVLDSASIRRLDIALDTFDGSVSHDKVLKAYEAGLFKRAEGGRNPKMKKIEGSCLTDGRTVYIGSRSSYKYIRTYEKGWQLCSSMPESFRTEELKILLPGLDNPVNVADYYRVELELKAKDGMVIPWETLTNPDIYFAGGAPYLASLVDAAPQRIQSAPEVEARVQLEGLIQHCRTAYGGLFRAWALMHGDSAECKQQLFDELAADMPSERLIKNGVLLLV